MCRAIGMPGQPKLLQTGNADLQAMILRRCVSVAEQDEPLELTDIPIPIPVVGGVLLRVLTCGVCHTELDEIEGRTTPTRLPIVPGHEVVGIVESVEPSVTHYDVREILQIAAEIPIRPLVQTCPLAEKIERSLI